MNRKKIIWRVVIALIICFIFYYFGPILGWFLTPSYTTLRVASAPNTYIDIDDPDYPLEFVSDGYKFTRISGGKVYWVWQYTVRNKSNKDYYIKVTFNLLDSDGFKIDSSYAGGWVRPNNDITIQGESNFSSYDLRRFFKRTWLINYSTSEF